MVYFQTKNPNLSKFWEALAIEDVGILMAILSILRPNGILWPFGTFCGHFLACCTEKKIWQPCLTFPSFHFCFGIALAPTIRLIS
jgi:hypothetical protein